MRYSIIYLDGKRGLPFIECEVCKRIKRNVIEPVAVFVPKGREEEFKEKIRGLSKEGIRKNLEKIYKNIAWYKRNPESYLTCILHCSKENEIWIRNFRDGYEKYAEKRDRAIKEKKPFYGNFKIVWDGKLVRQFWKRIRAYRFAVDYISLWRKVNENWNEFLENLKKREHSPSKEELNQDKDLILFNFSKLIIPIIDNYDFRFINFPELIDSSINLFYRHEKLVFNAKINFRKATFISKADFSKTTFDGADFRETTFNGGADFRETTFDGAEFKETTFNGKAYFWETTFNGVAFFLETTFNGKAYFWETTFDGKAYFLRTTFSSETVLGFSGKTGRILFGDILTTDKTKIEIRNLKTVNLQLLRISNQIEDFFFYDTEILNIEDYKSYLKENNIEVEENLLRELERETNLLIKDSHLNKMKFVNCDFSKAKHIKIESSDLTEAKFVNVDWGEISERRICSKLFNKEPKKARDIYRQLKLALDNQKDHITANEFYSLEMKAYERYLKSRSWRENFQEKVVFSVHKFVSNFGQSWIRPFILLLISTLIVGVLGSFKSWEEMGGTLFTPFTPVFASVMAIIIFTLLYIAVLPERCKKSVEITYALLTIALSCVVIYARKGANSLDYLAEILNITKTFKVCNASNEHLLGFKFIYTLYTILLAFLTYQFIVAVRRKVKR